LSAIAADGASATPLQLSSSLSERKKENVDDRVFIFLGGGESIWRRNEAILPCFFEFRWRVEHLKKENGAISTVLKGVLNSARKGGLPSRLDKNNNACIDNPMEAGL